MSEPKCFDGMELRLNDARITCARGEDGVVGPDRVLLDDDDNLIAGTDWESRGYAVVPFLEPADWTRLRDGLRELFHELLSDAGADAPDDLRLEHYHRYVGDNEETHLAIARQLADGFPVERLAIDHRRIVDRLGSLLHKPLTMGVPFLDYKEVFCLRAVRPQSADNNPLHRDPWLDRLRNAVNLYVPVAGSNENSSLALVPGSHRWKESEVSRTPGGARIGSARFSVPSLVGATRPVNAIRPNPGENEVLVFSPYMLHGGASNLNQDATRISIEMRLWRAPA